MPRQDDKPTHPDSVPWIRQPSPIPAPPSLGQMAAPKKPAKTPPTFVVPHLSDDVFAKINELVSHSGAEDHNSDELLTAGHSACYNGEDEEPVTAENPTTAEDTMATVDIIYDENGKVVEVVPAGQDAAPETDETVVKMTKKEEKDLISLRQFAKLIPDENAAIAFFEQKRWGDTPTCPRCGSESVYRVKSGQPMSHRCRPCRKYFSVRIGTLMEDTNLPVRDWLLAIFHIHSARKGVSSHYLAKILGITQKTAWFLLHRVREAMTQGDLRLGGIVEVDETYLGGSDSNRHQNKKQNGSWRTRRLMVFGAKQRNGSVVASVVWGGITSELLDAVRGAIIPGSTVMSDGEIAYRYLPNFGFGHEWVNHSVGEYVRDQASTNGIESFWALLKRGYMGTFHVMSWKHTHRYVNEFAFRHNAGPGNGFRTIACVLEKMGGKRLTWKVLTAENRLPAETK